MELRWCSSGLEMGSWNWTFLGMKCVEEFLTSLLFSECDQCDDAYGKKCACCYNRISSYAIFSVFSCCIILVSIFMNNVPLQGQKLPWEGMFSSKILLYKNCL